MKWPTLSFSISFSVGGTHDSYEQSDARFALSQALGYDQANIPSTDEAMRKAGEYLKFLIEYK